MSKYVYCFRFIDYMTETISDEKGWHDRNTGIRIELVLIPVSRVVEVCGPRKIGPFPKSDRIIDEDGDDYYCARRTESGGATMSDFSGSIVKISQAGLFHLDGRWQAKLGYLEIPFKQTEDDG